MHLVAEETAGDVDLLAPDDDNLLAVENLLRDNRSEATKKMALAVDDNGGGGESGHGASERDSEWSGNGVNTQEFSAERELETNLEVARGIDRVQSQREADWNT